MITDDIYEIIVELKALRTLASGIDPHKAFEDFGWGLSNLLDHVIRDLKALKEEAAIETGERQ